jgi:hypothetical protein
MKIRRVRTEGRKAAVAAAVLALVGVGTGGVFLASALAGAKPPTPTITGFPANPTVTTGPVLVHFAYSDTQNGVTFKCSLDGVAFTATGCPNTGITYASVPQGNHTFQVEAVSGSNTGSAASYSWAFVPPAPTILTHPTNPTGATTATFTFSDPTQPTVPFKCAIDGSSFTTCTSGKNYTGLSGGSHTFQVEAQVGSNPPSAATSFGWAIDLSAPVITITFPADGGSYNVTGWSAGCSPVGICGTASDTPAGVQSVAVALRQLSSGKYWNGTAFSSNSILFNPTTGTPTTWKYAKSLPPDGQYTVSVRATDNFGNTTANGDLKTATFTIDTVAPATPVITDKPSNPSKDKTPEFEYTDTSANVTFTCKLDNGALTPCTGDSDHDGDGNSQGEHNGHGSTFGEIQYGTLTPGPHCFTVYATDPAGNVSPTTTPYCWTVTGTTTATTITVVSGTPQDTTISTAFGAVLKAKVTDASNNPVTGVTVTFAAPTTGASGTFAASGCTSNSPTTTCTVTTDGTGVATSSVFTANGTPGGYTVTATATGVATPANFSLINDTSFPISGNIPNSDPSTQGFYPGLTQSFNLSIANPYNFSLTVTGLTITVSPTTTNGSCAGSNLTVTRPFSGVVHINPNTPATTLTGLLATPGQLPQLTMAHSAPDACQGATFSLSYTGTASTP